MYINTSHYIFQALWCGWVVKSPNYKYYFAGDSGYQDELFKLIGIKYGPFDLASIPIGGYEPRYITEFVSRNPEEAVKVHMDIHSRVSIGINWGTFELTNEYYLEPPQELEKQMYNKHLDPKTFFNLRIGETWIVGDDRDYNPPFMAREKTRTQRHNDDPLTQRHGDDPPTHRNGDDQPTQRQGDDPPTQRHGDDPPTQRLNDGPWKLGAVGSNQHVRKGEKVEASGKFTNNAVGEDQDDDPPLKDTDTRITLSLNNVPGELGAAGSNQHVRKDEKVEASGVLTSEAVGEDQDDDLPFMERGITGTLSLNNGRLDGGLGGYVWKPALSECENYHLHRIDPFCQDIKVESRRKQTERSNPREISPDQPWPHNNQEDSVTGIKPTGRSAPRSMALDAPSTHTNYEYFITGMKPTGHSTPRTMSLDAPWTHNNQEDFISGIKPTGRSKPRSMAFGSPWTHNNREDSVTGMKPTGRSKPRNSLSQDASSQRKNQDSASSIKPTGRSARD